MDNFWQANFWGIIGTFTGVFGFLISLLNWRYSKPKIKIAELGLKLYKPELIKQWYPRGITDQHKNNILKFDLHIVIKNKRGGTGSVEKPILIIYIPKDKGHLFNNFEKIKLKPRPWTQNGDDDRAVAWNLAGGETHNDYLEYDLYGSDNFSGLVMTVENYDSLRFKIEYKDNFGCKHGKRIKNITYNY